MFYILGLLGGFAVSNQSPINARLGGASHRNSYITV